MNAVERLALIQQATNTPALPWTKEYEEWLIEDLKKRTGSQSVAQLKRIIADVVKRCYSYELPTPFESALHYPMLYELLKELYAVKDVALSNHSQIDVNIEIPVIGTMNNNEIYAFTDPEYNLIVIDRSLYFFLTSITSLIICLVTTKEEERYVIRPSKLSLAEQAKRIGENKKLRQQFVEILCSYALFKSVLPYERVHFGNRDQNDWAETVSREVLRFVVGHEFAHIILKDTKSTPTIEADADWLGAYLCTVAIHNDPELRSIDLYWAMAITVKALDIMQKCDTCLGKTQHTHPANRIGTIAQVLKAVKADPYCERMILIIHQVFTLLWNIEKDNILNIVNSYKEGHIKTIDELKSVIYSDIKFE